MHPPHHISHTPHKPPKPSNHLSRGTKPRDIKPHQNTTTRPTHTNTMGGRTKRLPNIINSLSRCIEKTCMSTPTPPLTTKAKIQGGFLPRKQQKIWKHQIKIYHGARKAIRAACQHPHTHLQNHPDITSLTLLTNLDIPTFPTNPTEYTQWIEKIANIRQKVKLEAHKIIPKKTVINCKNVITKYKALLNIKPKTIHKKIFHPTIESSLDCIQNSKGDILTRPQDIANEIYSTQQTSFQRQIPLCSDTTDHPSNCQCAICKYSWHTHNGIILDKKILTPHP